MTPLLPQPVPWPAGEALPWARDRHWEGVTALGSVAIQPVPHRVDEETLTAGLERWLPREGIADLRVRCQGSRLRPSWHGANGLYGFVGLPAGVHRFTIEDPLGRYLPARFSLSVADRRAVAESLQRLERPALAEDWRLLVHRLPLRPSPGAVRRPGSTGLWGEVRDAGDRPIPFALVQLQTRLHSVAATATTWSDAAGGYALDLDGERPDPLANPADVVQRDGRLCLPLPPAAGTAQPWIELMPVLDQALVQGIATGLAPAGYGPPRASGTDFRFRDGPGGTLRDRVPLRIGRQQRWDLVLI
ncbi:carboxypeptidase-like regulatory domain-containing protein [Synechococcus sp. BA-132 BA5]|uniref:carboxypeptidase-like regulatory domain-containing protein n=1 Tax=Synechococcus sp. BA-132 BA5 TaxID=3110252 RepID=UPI002B1FBE66|nr:carboxypeptidase-like regulatory domain-containing protein [Synechococcus sp. BA-132 BA5]MEA5416847.1 carboxypeptidase-like regulatory domain-containing protein [Synechococcus sp. BA-132 BA5]